MHPSLWFFLCVDYAVFVTKMLRQGVSGGGLGAFFCLNISLDCTAGVLSRSVVFFLFIWVVQAGWLRQEKISTLPLTRWVLCELVGFEFFGFCCACLFF